jgi:hypothetical protein
MATGFRRNMGKEVVCMTYSNAEERSSLIAGLRDLADFLEGRPEVPAPRWADVTVFPPHSTDIVMKAAIDSIAALIGTDISDQAAENAWAHTPPRTIAKRSRSKPMLNLAIDPRQHCCRCGALCETTNPHCKKCRDRSRWYRRKAWRINPQRDTNPAATPTKEVISR